MPDAQAEPALEPDIKPSRRTAMIRAVLLLLLLGGQRRHLLGVALSPSTAATCLIAWKGLR